MSQLHSSDCVQAACVSLCSSLTEAFKRKTNIVQRPTWKIDTGIINDHHRSTANFMVHILLIVLKNKFIICFTVVREDGILVPTNMDGDQSFHC